MICNISSHLVGCLFTLDTVFWHTIFLNSSWSPSCLFFSFHTFASYIIAKKIISSPKSWFAFPSVISDEAFILFYSKSFIISGLHLGPWFTFELIFVYGAESTFILLHMDIQFSQHHLSKGGFSLFLQHFKLHICCLISSVQQPHKASTMDFYFFILKCISSLLRDWDTESPCSSYTGRTRTKFMDSPVFFSITKSCFLWIFYLDLGMESNIWG